MEFYFLKKKIIFFCPPITDVKEQLLRHFGAQFGLQITFASSLPDLDADEAAISDDEWMVHNAREIVR